MTTDKQQGALIVKLKSLAVAACTASLFFSANLFAQSNRPPQRTARTNTRSAAPQRQAAPRSTAPRSAAPRSAVGRPVAVVDVSLIFKNHRGFKARMDGMKQQVQDYENSLRSRHEALAKEREKLKQYKPGSPNYKQLEQKMADGAAKLSVDTQLKKKEFLQMEARAYYETYQEVRGVIQSYAEANGIGLVLRFTREQINPDDRQSVLAGVNRAIVYQKGQLDITSAILNNLDRAPRVSNRPPTRTRAPRQN